MNVFTSVHKVKHLLNKKVKAVHYTPERRLRERRYSSYSFSNSALDGGEWSASRPDHALFRGKDPQYPLYRRLGGPQSRSGHGDTEARGKILSSLPEIEPRSSGRPARSQTLHWLSYPAHIYSIYPLENRKLKRNISKTLIKGQPLLPSE
jgi:hypothetical protein